MEKAGAKECSSGSKVLDKSKCESACVQLKIEKDTAELVDGRTCFSSLNQKCRMLTRLPPGTSFRLICKRSGD